MGILTELIKKRETLINHVKSIEILINFYSKQKIKETDREIESLQNTISRAMDQMVDVVGNEQHKASVKFVSEQEESTSDLQDEEKQVTSVHEKQLNFQKGDGYVYDRPMQFGQHPPHLSLNKVYQIEKSANRFVIKDDKGIERSYSPNTVRYYFSKVTE